MLGSVTCPFSEFRSAFEAWKKTHPVHNPAAPPGPQAMKEYRSSRTERAAKLNQEAAEVFQRGTHARQRSDDYVRLTVTLATILLLTTISQRFKTERVRLALVVLS